MRMSVIIDDNIHRRVQSEAILAGCTVAEMAEKLLAQALGIESEAETEKKNNRKS